MRYPSESKGPNNWVPSFQIVDMEVATWESMYVIGQEKRGLARCKTSAHNLP